MRSLRVGQREGRGDLRHLLATPLGQLGAESGRDSRKSAEAAIGDEHAHQLAHLLAHAGGSDDGEHRPLLLRRTPARIGQEGAELGIAGIEGEQTFKTTGDAVQRARVGVGVGLAQVIGDAEQRKGVALGHTAHMLRAQGNGFGSHLGSGSCSWG